MTYAFEKGPNWVTSTRYRVDFMSKLLRWCGFRISKVLAKMDQGVGKLRRFALVQTNAEYIARMHKKRLGECHRCGLCCHFLFECPFLRTLSDSTCRCVIHGQRPDNCKRFPIDERDLRDRDLVDATVPCGYRFKDH